MSTILDSIVLGTYSTKSNKSWYLHQITQSDKSDTQEKNKENTVIVAVIETCSEKKKKRKTSKEDCNCRKSILEEGMLPTSAKTKFIFL